MALGSWRSPQNTRSKPPMSAVARSHSKASPVCPVLGFFGISIALHPPLELDALLGSHINKRQHDRPNSPPIAPIHPKILHPAIKRNPFQNSDRRFVAVCGLGKLFCRVGSPVPCCKFLSLAHRLPTPVDSGIRRPRPTRLAPYIACVAPSLYQWEFWRCISDCRQKKDHA